jgi:hypothetical protein
MFVVQVGKIFIARADPAKEAPVAERVDEVRLVPVEGFVDHGRGVIRGMLVEFEEGVPEVAERDGLGDRVRRPPLHRPDDDGSPERSGKLHHPLDEVESLVAGRLVGGGEAELVLHPPRPGANRRASGSLPSSSSVRSPAGSIASGPGGNNFTASKPRGGRFLTARREIVPVNEWSVSALREPARW